jgi:hypothetical protein
MKLQSIRTRAAELQLFAKIISGVNQHVTTSILLGGQSRTGTSIVADFNAAIQANTDLDAAKAVYQQKLAAQKAAFTTARATASALKSYADGAYGKTNTILNDFGFEVAKAVVKSVKVKAEAAVKSAATRVARHTMGAKQKASIHGTVEVPANAASVPVVTPAPGK